MFGPMAQPRVAHLLCCLAHVSTFYTEITSFSTSFLKGKNKKKAPTLSEAPYLKWDRKLGSVISCDHLKPCQMEHKRAILMALIQAAMFDSVDPKISPGHTICRPAQATGSQDRSVLEVLLEKWIYKWKLLSKFKAFWYYYYFLKKTSLLDKCQASLSHWALAKHII